MGTSISTNTTENVNRIVNQAVTDAFQAATASSDQAIDIKIEGGDRSTVVVDGNTIGQIVNFSGDAFNQSLTDSQADQSLNNEIKAASAAQTSGLSFNSIAVSTTYVEAINDLANSSISTIQQRVNTEVISNITFDIEVGDDSVVQFSNNDFAQTSNQIINIVNESVTQAIQSAGIDEQIESEASASVEGIDLNLFLVLLALFGAVILGLFFVFGYAFKKVFDSWQWIAGFISIIVGIIFLVIWSAGYETMRYFGYSGDNELELNCLINNAQQLDSTDQFLQPQNAGSECEARANCDAFSWDPNINPQGVVEGYTTIFWQGRSCETVTQNGDQVDTIKVAEDGVVTAPNYTEISWTGLKITAHNNWYLWLGLFFVALGLLLLVFSSGGSGNSGSSVTTSTAAVSV